MLSEHREPPPRTPTDRQKLGYPRSCSRSHQCECGSSRNSSLWCRRSMGVQRVAPRLADALLPVWSNRPCTRVHMGIKRIEHRSAKRYATASHKRVLPGDTGPVLTSSLPCAAVWVSRARHGRAANTGVGEEGLGVEQSRSIAQRGLCVGVWR